MTLSRKPRRSTLRSRILPGAAALGAAALLSIQAVSSHAGLNLFGITGDDKPSLAPLIEEVTDAVVNISVIHQVQTRDPFWEFFQNQPRTREHTSAGSGVIVDAKEGLVVTNHHVIANASGVTITLQDKRFFEATLVGSDPATDVALLRIDADKLKGLDLSDSDLLSVGDFVLAIGNPFGVGQTVTSGIVSALGRSLDSTKYEDFIQTDASINPGNSGGALIDLNGRLIGINTVILSHSGSSAGVGFAIPSNMVNRVIDQLVRFGNVQRGIFGVSVRDVADTDLAARKSGDRRGGFVASIERNSEAARAGIKIGDIITEINGETVEDSFDVRNKLGLMRIGEEFSVTYVRGNRVLTTSGEIGIDLVTDGVEFQDIPSNHPYSGKLSGISIARLDDDSDFANAGFVVDDVIMQVNDTRVRSINDLSRIDWQARPLILAGYSIRSGRRFQLRMR